MIEIRDTIILQPMKGKTPDGSSKIRRLTEWGTIIEGHSLANRRNLPVVVSRLNPQNNRFERYGTFYPGGIFVTIEGKRMRYTGDRSTPYVDAIAPMQQTTQNTMNL